MLFNKNNNGSEELRKLTGNYYANNDFAKVEQDVIMSEEELIKIIGHGVYEKAETHYKRTDEQKGEMGQSEKQLADDLLIRIQLPVAIYATFQMYRKNDVSHEGTGRKVKIDPENEKLPWQWQLERDDEVQLENYFKAVDRLIDWMDAKEIAEWLTTDTKKAMQKQLVKDAATFDRYYPIERSSRFFVMVSPFVREAERRYIRPALGAVLYKKYIGEITDPPLTPAEIELKEWILPAIPLLAMSIAFRRMPLGLIPFGVVRNYKSESQTMNASTPATMAEIAAYSAMLKNEGLAAIAEFKAERSTDDLILPLIPNNDIRNKYMKV